MIISLNILKNSLDKYNSLRNNSVNNFRNNSRNRVEKYTKSKNNDSNNSTSSSSGFVSAFYIFLLIVSLIFFLFELVLLYFAVFIAINCSKSREERIVNFVLAVVFTIPYVLLNILFNPCAKEYLQNGMKRNVVEE
jgi:hypothetical protein